MKGDESEAHQCWVNWLDEHGWRLLMHARQIHFRSPDAQDLVQEVLLELWLARSGGAPPDLPLALHKLRQRAIDRGRSTSRRIQREQNWQDQIPIHVFPVMEQDHAFKIQIVQKALDQLSIPFREVISLKLWSELTFDEIGEVLNISRNTAGSRYRLALEKLKPLLESIRP